MIKMRVPAKLILLVIFSLSYAEVTSSDYNEDRGESSWQASNPIDECLKIDSISCIQIQMFRTARDFFNKPAIEVFGGAQLVKGPARPGSARNLAVTPEVVEQKLSSKGHVQQKAQVLEDYMADEARNFFERRTIQWNMATLGRNLVNAAPERLKEIATELMSEGRGKKKVMKMLLPFLLGLKIKFATVMGLVFFGVVLLAKKAMLLSLLSIAVSTFLLLRKMFYPSHEQMHPYNHAPGWQSHSDVGQVEYAANPTAPIAQQMAYSAQKPAQS